MPSLQEAIQYISYYRAQGYSDEQIRMGLVQQGYPDEILQEAFTPSTKEHHKHTNIFIIVATVVLCLGAATFFFLMGNNDPIQQETARESTTDFLQTTTSTGIRLTTTTLRDYTYKASSAALAYKDEDQQRINKLYKAKLCYTVNPEKEPYCFLNPYGDFTAGDEVYIYFRPLLNSVEKDSKHIVAYTQTRTVIDPLGNEVKAFSATPITYEREVSSPGTYGVGSFNSINTTRNMALGEYYFKLDIRHTLTGKRETIIMPFFLN